MALEDAAYNALDFLLSQQTSDAASALRSQLAVDYHGEDDLPADHPAFVAGAEPETAQTRAAAAQAAYEKAAADLAAAESALPPKPAEPTPTQPDPTRSVLF
jgi:hypothetical protein